MLKQKKHVITDIVVAVSLSIFIFSFAVVFALNFKPLYYWDIKALNLSSTTGFSEELIQKNYSILINYNSIFSNKELSFEQLPMSSSGKFHFEEVRTIFVIVQIILIISLLTSVFLIAKKVKTRQYNFLLFSSIFSIGLPTLLGIVVAINWQAFFLIFHKLFFNNDAWLFNPVTDPIITFLPDEFFMHCAILIIAIILLAGICCLMFYILSKKRKSVKPQNKLQHRAA